MYQIFKTMLLLLDAKSTVLHFINTLDKSESPSLEESMLDLYCIEYGTVIIYCLGRKILEVNDYHSTRSINAFYLFLTPIFVLSTF